MFAKRLDLDEAVRASLAASFERWNGRGLPDGRKGSADPPSDAHRAGQPGARGAGPHRGHRPGADDHPPPAGQGVRPDAHRLVLGRGRGLVGRRSSRSTRGTPRSPSRPPGRAARARTPAHEALLVLADFSDLKSPWLGGHSRAVAALALDACGPDGRGGRAGARPRSGRRPQHGVGQARRRSPGTSATAPRLHALVTDQLLRRVPYTAPPGRRSPARRTSASTAPATTAGSAARTSTRRSGCSRRPTATRR